MINRNWKMKKKKEAYVWCPLPQGFSASVHPISPLFFSVSIVQFLEFDAFPCTCIWANFCVIGGWNGITSGDCRHFGFELTIEDILLHKLCTYVGNLDCFGHLKVNIKEWVLTWGSKAWVKATNFQKFYRHNFDDICHQVKNPHFRTFSSKYIYNIR